MMTKCQFIFSRVKMSKSTGIRGSLVAFLKIFRTFWKIQRNRTEVHLTFTFHLPTIPHMSLFSELHRHFLCCFLSDGSCINVPWKKERLTSMRRIDCNIAFVLSCRCETNRHTVNEESTMRHYRGILNM